MSAWTGRLRTSGDNNARRTLHRTDQLHCVHSELSSISWFHASVAHLHAFVFCRFHIRIPFVVNMLGTYNFRMHADYGRGGFIGVDGAQYTGGNVYSHVETGPLSLTSGEHEFEALGFESCCDGFANVEVHLPCDSTGSPWRIVQSGSEEGADLMGGGLGALDCLTCGAVLEGSCAGPVTDPGGGATGIDAGTAVGTTIQTGDTGNGGCGGTPTPSWCHGTGR